MMRKLAALPTVPDSRSDIRAYETKNEQAGLRFQEVEAEVGVKHGARKDHSDETQREL